MFHTIFLAIVKLRLRTIKNRLMYLEIKLSELTEIISTSVDAGIQAYMRETNPKGDRIKKTEAKRYITRCGFQPSILDKWQDAGLIHGAKPATSTAKNACEWYSLAEIKTLISAIKLKKVCNNQNN